MSRPKFFHLAYQLCFEIGVLECVWCLHTNRATLHVDGKWNFNWTTHVGSHRSQVARGQLVISTVGNMEVGTCHFTPGVKPKVPSTTWMSTWHRFMEVRLDSTLNTNPTNIFAQHNQDPTWFIMNRILMISWGSKLGLGPSNVCVLDWFLKLVFEFATKVTLHVDSTWSFNWTTHAASHRSQVPSHRRSTCVISTAGNMEVGTCHWVKPWVPSMTWMSTWHQFMEVIRLDPTLIQHKYKQKISTQIQRTFLHNIIKDPTWFITNRIPMISWGSKLGLGNWVPKKCVCFGLVFWSWVFEFATEALRHRRSCPPPLHLRRRCKYDSIGDDARAFLWGVVRLGEREGLSFVIECWLWGTPILEWLWFVCLPDTERAPDHAILSRNQ